MSDGPSIETPPAVAERLDALADLLTGLHLLYWQTFDSPDGWVPAPGSTAEAEAQQVETGPAGEWGPGEFGHLLHVSGELMTVGSYLVHGLSLLVRAGEVVFPKRPLLRSIFEHSVLTMQFFDFEVPLRQRIARVWQQECHDLELELRAIGRTVNDKSDPNYQSVKLRRAKVLDHIKDLFDPVDATSLEKVVIEGNTRRGYTEAGEWYAARRQDIDLNAGGIGRGAYDMLSGLGHPNLAINREWFEITEDEAGTRRLISETPATAARQVELGARSYLDLIGFTASYLGRYTDRIDEFNERWTATLGGVAGVTAAQPD